MALRERLIAQVRATGPLTIAQYMTACLHDPQDGYYATRPALGEDGDFITAPLVSQMFGELVGLWLVQTWIDLRRPAPFMLVEAGPGDGTLMSDILRAAEVVPEFAAAAKVWLVETSEPLRRRQRALLGDGPRHAADLDEVPVGAPMLLVANELLDCLPARQFVRVDGGWAERMVGLDGNALAFGLAAVAGQDAPTPAGPAPHGSVLEWSPAQEAFGRRLGERIARDGGAALLIDYGRAVPGFGDTLQALHRHTKEGPLDRPGEADLTVHADFPAVLAAARESGAATAPTLTQGEFLVRLGVGARAEALANARPDRSEVLERQLERLVSPDQMGELFKVACIHQKGFAPPAFDESA